MSEAVELSQGEVAYTRLYMRFRRANSSPATDCARQKSQRT